MKTRLETVAGSLCSTVGDLLAWNRALHREKKILSPDMYRALVTPATLNDGTPLRYAQGIVAAEIERESAVRNHGDDILR